MAVVNSDREGISALIHLMRVWDGEWQTRQQQHGSWRRNSGTRTPGQLSAELLPTEEFKWPVINRVFSSSNDYPEGLTHFLQCIGMGKAS